MSVNVCQRCVVWIMCRNNYFVYQHLTLSPKTVMMEETVAVKHCDGENCGYK